MIKQSVKGQKLIDTLEYLQLNLANIKWADTDVALFHPFISVIVTHGVRWDIYMYVLCDFKYNGSNCIFIVLYILSVPMGNHCSENTPSQ